METAFGLLVDKSQESLKVIYSSCWMSQQALPWAWFGLTTTVFSVPPPFRISPMRIRILAYLTMITDTVKKYYLNAKKCCRNKQPPVKTVLPLAGLC